MNKLKKSLDAAMQNVDVTPALREQILRPPKRRSPMRIILVAACLAAFFSMATFVFAATQGFTRLPLQREQQQNYEYSIVVPKYDFQPEVLERFRRLSENATREANMAELERREFRTFDEVQAYLQTNLSLGCLRQYENKAVTLCSYRYYLDDSFGAMLFLRCKVPSPTKLTYCSLTVDLRSSTAQFALLHSTEGNLDASGTDRTEFFQYTTPSGLTVDLAFNAQTQNCEAYFVKDNAMYCLYFGFSPVQKGLQTYDAWHGEVLSDIYRILNSF